VSICNYEKDFPASIFHTKNEFCYFVIAKNKINCYNLNLIMDGSYMQRLMDSSFMQRLIDFKRQLCLYKSKENHNGNFKNFKK